MAFRYQPPAQSIQVRQADQHHYLGGVLGQPAIAHFGVAELQLDDAEEMLDTRPDPRIHAVAFLLAAGEPRPEAALGLGLAQMLVAGFGSSRPDRIVWPDRKWEWAALRSENGDFELPTGIDLEARDRWFSQAVGVSPKMFLRTAGAGSLYWLGLRDKDGAHLDGGKTYKLSVPQPVPQKLF
jgi:hypothetical protein